MSVLRRRGEGRARRFSELKAYAHMNVWLRRLSQHLRCKALVHVAHRLITSVEFHLFLAKSIRSISFSTVYCSGFDSCVVYGNLLVNHTYNAWQFFNQESEGSADPFKDYRSGAKAAPIPTVRHQEHSVRVDACVHGLAVFDNRYISANVRVSFSLSFRIW